MNPAVVCYGVVPLRRSEQGIDVYIIHRTLGFWELPKGHGEGEELPCESAERELFEETGLTISHWLREDPYTIFYTIPQGLKQVDYWAALVEGEPRVQLAEVLEGEWLPWEEALTRLSFDNNREVLKWAITCMSS